MRQKFDIDGDRAVTKADSIDLENLISYATESLPQYYIADFSGENNNKVLLLLDENGDWINELAKDYAVFDLDCNGYIDLYDARYVSNVYFYNKW